mmetsp:Transcript_2947/g.3327  ORF Transcript_2947/g.3327 Transcript_2947/m.3327 type:complete len:341 (+) Transcript_2947:49-1071(+)
MTMATTTNCTMIKSLLLLWSLPLIFLLFQITANKETHNNNNNNNHGFFFVSSFVPIITVHHGSVVGATTSMNTRKALLLPLYIATTDDAEDSNKSDSKSSTTSSQSSKTKTNTNTNVDAKLFPVLQQLDGINWEGSCRYVNEQLIPSHNLKLYGGIQFDLTYGSDVDGDDTSNNQNEIEMNSFLLFPNGNRRDIEMRGNRGPTAYPSFRLDPPILEDGTSGGPIHMVVTEMAPDTILINEVDKASRKIVMTSSLSLVKDVTTGTIQELIQISHEVGMGATAARVGESVIEGHQVWRFTPGAKQLQENKKNEDEDEENNDTDDDDHDSSDSSFTGLGTTYE